MTKKTRRKFLQMSAVTAVSAPFVSAQVWAAQSPDKKGSITLNNREVGIYISLDADNVDGTFKKIQTLGFTHCELYTDKYSMDMAKPIKKAMEKFGVSVHALFTLGPGPTKWDFYEGQSTIGLVCREYREVRVEAMLRLSDLAKACDIPMVETHVGYIPENPLDPNYAETVEALKRVVAYCKKNGQIFLYHAGQESPTTVKRCIEDVGYDNQGIGLDTANLIMYDRGHPTYSLGIYGKYVKLVSCKDGLFPTDTRELGREVQIGSGKVDFPVFIKELIISGYAGPVIIEREDARDHEWDKDVSWSKQFIEKLLNP